MRHAGYAFPTDAWGHKQIRREEVAVVDVPLSTDEIEIIRFVVERYRKAMIFEIAHTDSRELKKHLREREDMIEALIQRLDSFAREPDTLSS